MTNAAFQELIQKKGRELYRNMPWRDDTRLYYVLVSEIMLQQTQVDRVIPKFTAFIDRFPSEHILAQAELGEVLTMWNGLGYNRRAKFLWQASQRVSRQVPKSIEELVALPGVGTNTAGAIMAYVYNKPALFIETNIRTVYFHHFFHDQTDVHDKDIMTKLAETLDNTQPRQFYWGLMDYGSWLKAQGLASLNKSKHYKKQSPLKGSLREIRGQILKTLSVDRRTLNELRNTMVADDRFMPALSALENEQLVQKTGRFYHL
jgi:A/G-specific adenine glycosylase